MERMVAAWSGGSQAEQQQQPSTTDNAKGFVKVPSSEPAAAPSPTGQAAGQAPEQGTGSTAEGGAEAGAGGVAPYTPHRQGPKAVPAGAGSAEAMKESLRDMAMQRSATARYMQVSTACRGLGWGRAGQSMLASDAILTRTLRLLTRQ